MGYSPTEEQHAFLESGLRSEGHTIGIGFPGCGKTATLESWLWQLSDKQQKDTLVCVYNRHTKDDLERRAPISRNVLTVDGLAWRAIRNHFNLNYNAWRPEREKAYIFTALFAREYWESVAEDGSYTPEQLQAMDDLRRLVSLTQATLTDPTNDVEMRRLYMRYEMAPDNEGFLLGGVQRILEWTDQGLPEPSSGSLWRIQDAYSFEELHWYLFKHPEVRVPRSLIMGADEIQDWTMSQWLTIKKSLGDKGRLVGVGDPRQALYHFRGVLMDMFGRIVNECKTTPLAMRKSFRLPRCVLPFAHRYVSDLEVVEGAIDGQFFYMEPGEAIHKMRPGFANIYLTNVQVVRDAYWALRNGKKVNVKGHGIGRDVNSLFDQLAAHKGFRMDGYLSVLEDWRKSEARRIEVRYRQPKRPLEALQERAMTMQYLYEGAVAEGINDVGEFRKRLRTLFAGEDRDEASPDAVLFMTAHRSKGSEYPGVLCELGDLKKPSNGMSPEEAQQQENACYVMLTRTKNLLGITRTKADGRTFGEVEYDDFF